jgi:hypothetical protein
VTLLDSEGRLKGAMRHAQRRSQPKKATSAPVKPLCAWIGAWLGYPIGSRCARLRFTPPPPFPLHTHHSRARTLMSWAAGGVY